MHAKLRALLPSSRPSRLVLFAATAILVTVLLVSGVALAGPSAKPASQTSPVHPAYVLLDADEQPVIENGAPVSTMKTCGSCHETEFIASHSDHASAGLDEMVPPGSAPSGRPWDTGTGSFGRWNPITYRYLSPQGDERLDLGTPAWIMELGARHVGGGPAETSREGRSLAELETSATDVETSILDPNTSETVGWDWDGSGTVEMNCFLCHTPDPNNTARLEALESGDFKWASTATLLGSGIVQEASGELTWNPNAFTAEGELKEEFVAIQDPTNTNCGLCHGLAHDDTDQPLVVAGCDTEANRTGATGQIISGEKISTSGMNLTGKETLDRPWDIHAERQVSCTDCHYSLNNPVYFQETGDAQPEHLSFDPRRLEIGEYLAQPVHQFARGQSALGTQSTDQQDTMRRCESCHTMENTHNWLPYKQRHSDVLTCETCHVPQVYAPAYQQYDWTSIDNNSSPAVECRGIDGPSGSITSLITGFSPALLQEQSTEGGARIAPYNLVSSWFWVYGDPQRPVRLQDLQAAWLQGDGYHPDILAVFDQDGDGDISDSERLIDSAEKQAAVAARLEALGLENPQISAEIQPYSINHTVASGDWATRDCQTCHSQDSRLAEPVKLASYVPGGVVPEFVQDSRTTASGEVYTDERGELWYRPDPVEGGVYVLGYNSVGWVDMLGSLLFFGVIVGIASHATLRYLSSMRRPRHAPELEPVYMYTVYERFWHWLQTFTILGLLFTGLIIHKPDTFGIFAFSGVVTVHNVLAGILLVNALLSLFYHLASGEIKQFIPRPYGFIDSAVSQALFYARGIFKGERHPFEKSPRQKFNPLQQVTYFAILNVLLPLQVITGLLMWGVQLWPDVAAAVGGLPYLAPFHTLVAWSFAAFIVAHVYLTTTGHAPMAGIKSMMVGWDELEVFQAPIQEEPQA